jgi:hypothetical protein
MHIGKNKAEQWALYHWANHLHDRQICLIYQDGAGRLHFRLYEHPLALWDGGQLLGELDWRNQRVVPLRKITDEQWVQMQRGTEEHRKRRAALNKMYSMAERIADLNGEKYSKPN